MPKGALKGQNRFKGTQEANISFRVKRLEEHVVPQMKAICDNAHIPNKTKFQKFCADVFNKDLPLNEKKITQRTIASNDKYWSIVGAVFHSYYDPKNATTLEALRKEGLNVLNDKMRIEELQSERNRLQKENEALNRYIAKSKLEHKSPTESSVMDNKTVNNLIATIDFLIKATDGVVSIDKETRTITNLADDINGELHKTISSTYFDILEGK
ncbi:hypothetical protein B5X20_RS03500 [Vibrio parahaemolyticus]|nr:hypothetical protein [Vibrio parahaemolyticus]EJG1627505.1 hypothetical protein [Vibrio parahaemolyticus]